MSSSITPTVISVKKTFQGSDFSASFSVFTNVLVAKLFFHTFNRLAGLEHQGPLGELVIRTCVGSAVLCAIIHLGEGSRNGRRSESKESRQRLKKIPRQGDEEGRERGGGMKRR